MNPTENEPEQPIKNDQLRALNGRIRLRAEGEKARLAQEIHDGLSQSLSELSMRVWFLDSCLKEENLDRTEAQKMSRELICLVERVVTSAVELEGKVAPRIEKLGFIAAVDWQREKFQKQTGINTSLSTLGTDDGFDNEAALEIYRVIEELLSNVSKHANATRVDIKLSFLRESPVLLVEVLDNGIGITTEQWAGEKSLGLFEVRERVECLGGAVHWARKTKGTAINFRVPVSALSVRQDFALSSRSEKTV